ncbi:sigma-54 dependent transcriptional regulator [Sphaerotilus sp.]|uniref:sigma-54-dependent transcriptional regulator n=1 Tax=Sphaerotilus sp. TaxID=2093942 RepID=UPI002ACEBA30|nr:sigma-54 dependent transcriptional regulator [Sphaerotilus sp.]MDZ7854707.1 sigma-54 dependent transcriptional regulator [Sphaerotilus sp.]
MNHPMTPRLLVVDDEPDLRTLYELALLREGYDIETAGTVEEAWTLLNAARYSAIITDMRLPDGTGLDLLRRLEQAGRPEKTIVITAYGSAENAVQALKSGAYDYLTKPVDLRQFRSVVASALGRAGTPAAVAAPRLARPVSRGPIEPRAMDALQRMGGRTPVMQQVRVLIDKVARSMAPVLVHGESGTGKELVARAIHQVSQRASGPCVAVNCGAIPEQLLEAEFFGYRKGAFTGANEDREGFFQAASGGTLFLDEIGDLPLAMQSKLLRVIQERAVRPVGAVAEVPLDVRIVSATHKDLACEVAAGRFRQDLYYRLNVIQIRVPPLRERLEDLPLLCEAVLVRVAGESALAEVPRLTEAALLALAQHRFPGNVRELENLLHRAVALSSGGLIDVADLGLTAAAAPASPESVATGTPVERSDPAAAMPVAVVATAEAVPTDLVAYLDEVERDVLVRALELHRYNRTAAGAAMGLTLRQMRYRMARLGIQVAGDALTVDDAEPLGDLVP